jgi:hypothetical protein
MTVGDIADDFIAVQRQTPDSWEQRLLGMVLTVKVRRHAGV